MFTVFGNHKSHDTNIQSYNSSHLQRRETTIDWLQNQVEVLLASQLLQFFLLHTVSALSVIRLTVSFNSITSFPSVLSSLHFSHFVLPCYNTATLFSSRSVLYKYTSHPSPQITRVERTHFFFLPKLCLFSRRLHKVVRSILSPQLARLPKHIGPIFYTGYRFKLRHARP